MHVPQGRGYVTRLSMLAAARTEGAFNGVPLFAGSSLMWEKGVDRHIWLVGVFGVLDMLI